MNFDMLKTKAQNLNSHAQASLRHNMGLLCVGIYSICILTRSFLRMLKLTTHVEVKIGLDVRNIKA